MGPSLGVTLPKTMLNPCVNARLSLGVCALVSSPLAGGLNSSWTHVPYSYRKVLCFLGLQTMYLISLLEPNIVCSVILGPELV